MTAVESSDGPKRCTTTISLAGTLSDTAANEISEVSREPLLFCAAWFDDAEGCRRQRNTREEGIPSDSALHREPRLPLQPAPGRRTICRFTSDEQKRNCRLSPRDTGPDDFLVGVPGRSGFRMPAQVAMQYSVCANSASLEEVLPES
jgi:hypothetical protein